VVERDNDNNLQPGLSSALSLAQNNVAKAESIPHANLANSRVDFHISAQPMETAVTELGAQSGLTIIVETKVSKGVKAPALSGQYTPEEALKKLLAPAGLKAEYLDSKTVVVRPDKEATRVNAAEPCQSGVSQSDDFPCAGLLRAAHHSQ